MVDGDGTVANLMGPQAPGAAQRAFPGWYHAPGSTSAYQAAAAAGGWRRGAGNSRREQCHLKHEAVSAGLLCGCCTVLVSLAGSPGQHAGTGVVCLPVVCTAIMTCPVQVADWHVTQESNLSGTACFQLVQQQLVNASAQSQARKTSCF